MQIFQEYKLAQDCVELLFLDNHSSAEKKFNRHSMKGGGTMTERNTEERTTAAGRGSHAVESA